MSLPPHVLCSCPKEFSIFLSYSHALRFNDKPNYVYTHRLFHDLFICEGYQYGHPFTRCIMGNSPDNQSAVARAGNNGGQKVLQEDMM
jgi:casein kinase I homolog HRR25